MNDNRYVLHVAYNSRGHITVGGRTLPSTTTDHGDFGKADREDQVLRDYLAPQFDASVTQVIHEVEEMRLNGKLRPFVEGEPVGVLPRRVRKRRLTDAEVRKERNKRMQDRQSEMLALRARNDETLAELLGRKF